NVTGFSNNAPSIATKRLQLLKEIAPHVARVAFLYDPLRRAVGASQFLAELEAVVSSFGIQLSGAAVHDAADIEDAIKTFAREPNGGLVMYSGGSIIAHRVTVIALASRYNLPAIYGFGSFVAEGGLASATDQVRVGYQPEDRQSPRPHHPG